MIPTLPSNDSHPPREQEEYDAINTGFIAAFVGLSPFIALAVGIYVVRRGPHNLLFSPETLAQYHWLAVLPLDQNLVGAAHPYLLQLLLVSNALAAIVLAVAVPWMLAPRPIAYKQYRHRSARSIKGLLVLVAAFLLGRSFTIHVIADTLDSNKLFKRHDYLGIIILPGLGVVCAVLLSVTICYVWWMVKCNSNEIE